MLDSVSSNVLGGVGANPSLPELFTAGERLLKMPAPDGLQIQRIAVLGHLTVDLLTRAVAYGTAQEDVFPTIYQAPFGTLEQQVLDRQSELHRFRPELTLLTPDWRALVQDVPLSASQDDVDASLAHVTAAFSALWNVLSEEVGCRILQHTLVPPCWRYIGQAERDLPASVPNQVRRLNRLFARQADDRVHWVELDRLAETIGTRAFVHTRVWHAGRLEFDQRFLPDYIPYFRAAWRSACARAKKVLVLDLDNTLWGGVIGDDGAAGLVLGPGTPAGEAFVAWQRYIGALRARGVILAVCSKNDPDIAKSGFEHPAMVLKQSDFAAFECSWNDKVQGLRRIATELNVGLDALVFVDDNPAECDLVRRELAQAAVVHLGCDPSRFIEIFDDCCWFDSARVTAADMTRGEAYAARAHAAATEIAVDIPAYLKGLEMRGFLARPDESDLDRVAQLEQKTNQFNLTTRRFQLSEIRARLNDPRALVLAFRIRDKFGNHGLVSTLFARHEGDELRIESWLMSCRVLGRSAEAFIMKRVIAAAAARGITWVVGEYRPTPKNGIVAGLFEQLGFERDGTRWVRLVALPVTDLATYIAEEP
jgi:FkbH-like protein